MIHLKKLIMTLVALIAVTTGAWAQTGENIFQYCYDCQRNPGYPTTMASAALSKFKNPYVGYKGIGSGMGNTSDGPWKMEYMGIWSTTDNHGINSVSNYQSTYNCTDVPVFRLYQWNATANEYQHAAYGVVCCYAKVSNAVEHTALFVAQGGWGCVLTNSSHSSSMNITFDEDLTTGLTTLIAAAKPAASGTPVPLTWDATAKTATLTNGMPAGNVTVSVEYYPQATAEGAVTAATDVKATTDAPLVTVDETQLTGVAKMMYYVSTDATAPAYNAEGWTDKVPTAENYTEAANLKVWYYPVGTDEGVGGATATYSDGDMNATALAVSLGDAPTYDVTLNAEGLSDEEAAAWKVAKGTDDPAAFPLEGVTKGETVTVTYTGNRKVIGVKAEKKGAAPAEGKTYTNLQGGEVLHVGDKITETEGKFRYTHHENPQLTDYYTYIVGARTYEVLRADVVYEGSNYKYTESPDGQYYVLKCTYFDYDDYEEWVTEYYFNQNLPVTGTSDGITVTLDGQDGYQRNLYTFWVHEPNP